MNQGNIEEIGVAESILQAPKSNYTRKLIAATPKVSYAEILARQSLRGRFA